MTNCSNKRFQPTEYRQALGTFATGVSVITAASDSGELAGITVNSFTSVSLEPPLILWCLANTSDSFDVFTGATHFAVNILAADQLSVSMHFAKKQKNKFKSIDYIPGQGGVPLLTDCVTWLQCQTTGQYDLGDHRVIIGEVLEFETNDKEALLFHQGNYAISLPFPELEPSHATDKSGDADESLYSLMIKAVHSYQENFETKQHEHISNSYMARMLLLLHKKNRRKIGDLSRGVQLSIDETNGLLDQMQNLSLLCKSGNDAQDSVKLTLSGQDKAASLWELAKQHEQEAVALFRYGDAESFRKSLIQLINWST